jgi:GT2 family glycosyltransferase
MPDVQRAIILMGHRIWRRMPMSFRRSVGHSLLQNLERHDAFRRALPPGARTRPRSGLEGGHGHTEQVSLSHEEHDPNLALALRRLEAVSVSESYLLGKRQVDDGALVTVVVPCFNDSRYLSECLESLLDQTEQRWRCLVVDDASTDMSAQLAFTFAHRDDRIQLIRHHVNRGLSASRNTGLACAETPFITFLDADDFLTPRSLERRVAALLTSTNPHVAGTYCGIRVVPENIVRQTVTEAKQPHLPRFEDFVTSEGECPFNAHAPVLRTGLVKKFGGFDENLRHGAEDWDLWSRMMRDGYYFVATPYVGGGYRQKQGSMVRANPGKHIQEAQRLLALANTDLSAHVNPPRYALPVAAYRAHLVSARRILQFAGVASAQGDATQLHEILGQYPVDAHELVERHIDILGTIETGVRRALGLIGARHSSLGPQGGAVVNAVTSAVGSLVKESRPIHRPSVPPVDVIFAPHDAYQAKAMLGVARGLSAQVQYAFITADAAAGDCGAARALEKAGEPSISITKWMLRPQAARVAVYMWPTNSLLVKAASALKAAGSLIFELEDELLPVERLSVIEVVSPDSVVSTTQAADILQRRLDSGSTDPKQQVAHVNSGRQWKDIVAKEEYPWLPADSDKIAQYRNIHEGERCFIIGNGPSLNKLDLGLLRDEITFGVNGIFYARDQLGGDPTYYVVEDSSVMRENLDAIRSVQSKHKFFPSLYRELYGAEDAIYFNMNRGFYEEDSISYCLPRFSFDPAQRVYCGQSVTHINLQLAYYMGFTDVILIGMDFAYVIPPAAKRRGDIIYSESDDENHFHKDYFGKGKTWKDPKLDRVLANYQEAQRTYVADGRTIRNATAGGQLNVFPRVDYASLF